MLTRAALFALAAALLAVAAVGCSPAPEDEPDPIALTATPVPDAEPTPDPSPEPSPTPDPSPTPTPEERDPTDTDRANFADEYDPDGTSGARQIAADVSGDGVQEVVFALIVDAQQRSRVDVAAWTGTRYEIVDRDLGGPADRIDTLRISDITADGQIEIVVIQSFGASGRSASLWKATAGAELERLVGHGDCFDGSHTYGDTDVEVADRSGDGRAEIRADCEDPDAPAELWPTVVYTWQDGAYRCDHRVSADNVRTECE